MKKKHVLYNAAVCAAAILLLFLIVPSKSFAAGERMVWAKTYNSGYPDSLYGTAIDSQSNVYISGDSWAITRDIYIVKYNKTNGNIAWNITYDSGGSDYFTGIAVDSADNVYITGASANGLFTAKYDVNGNQLWVRNYSNPYSGSSAITTDSANNIYIYGSARNPTTGIYDNLMLKYGTNGNLLWESLSALSGYGIPKIVIDNAGAIVVNQADRITKYDTSTGTVLWQTLSTTGLFCKGIGTDSQNNIYVHGNNTTVKFAPNGTMLWSATYPTTLGCASNNAIAVDAQGNAYIGGYLSTGGANVTILKYNTNGNLLWSGTHDIGTNNSLFPGVIKVNSNGDAYITGNGRDYTAGQYHLVTAKFDTNGVKKWAMQYNSGPDKWIGCETFLEIDNSGNIYVADYEGLFSMPNDWDNIIIRYNEPPPPPRP